MFRARQLTDAMHTALERGKSVLLLGARQTGKSTLAARFNPRLSVNFIVPEVLHRFSARSELLSMAIAALPRSGRKPPLVFLDEIQRWPACLDIAQDCIDRGVAQFILTGSSARHLRHGAKVNLLPGRVVGLYLDPFTFGEIPDIPLEQMLLDGSLPGIVSQSDAASRTVDLRSYVATYLEEEIRAQAAVRNLGRFSRFLELAALEAGNVVNFTKIAEDVGVAHTTIKAYYEILQDSLMLERIEPLSKSATRKKLTKSDKFLLFDLGVRRLCARDAGPSGGEGWGRLLEQWVGLELCRAARLKGGNHRIRFWRDPDGPEVDWVIDTSHMLTPIEVKWTDAPRERDIKHLKTFMQEYPQARHGYLVCRTPYRLALHDTIDAISWRDLASVWDQRLPSA